MSDFRNVFVYNARRILRGIVEVYYDELAYGTTTNNWTPTICEAIRQGRALFLQNVEPEDRKTTNNIYDEVLEEMIAEYVVNPGLIYIDANSFLSVNNDDEIEDIEANQKKHKQAKEFAELVVQDLEMFRSRIQEGVREGTLWNLMGKKFEGCYKYYLSRVEPSIASTARYFEHALANLIKSVIDQSGVDVKDDDYIKSLLEVNTSDILSSETDSEYYETSTVDPYEQVIDQVELPNEQNMLYDIALAYMDLRDYDLAIRIFNEYAQKSIQQKFRSSEPIACCYAEQGNINRAIRSLYDTVKLGFSIEECLGLYYLLGHFYERIGKIGEAIDAYYRVYRHTPDFRDTSLRLRLLGEPVTPSQRH